MSGGRVELGLGTGWFEAEHHAYGIPFPSLADRFDRLEEQLEVINGVWKAPVGSLYSFAGRHYALTNSPAMPKPIQTPRPPIIIGGKGPLRTPRLAARFADEFNIAYAELPTAAAQFDRVRAACEAAGRVPASVELSATVVVCCGRTDREVKERADAIGRSVDELRATALAGTPAEIVDTIVAWAAAGAKRLYLSVIDLSDLDHVAMIAEHILSQAADL
jgi:alkanesulfonate monooxygenase SsuD/methylene tetrahydromethanopterin reductase-like flavin-dependent oxidoreductase (luciferase family)